MMQLIRFNTARPFQRFLKQSSDNFQELKGLNPGAFDGISLNVRRLVAAALVASYDAEPARLAALIDHTLLPESGYKDKDPEKNPYQKTVHATQAMIDYLKAGTAKLNIEVLGPIEDEELRLTPDITHRYRLTERQYMHLALIYLESVSDNNKIMSVVSSNILHPFLYRGMTKETADIDNVVQPITIQKLQHSV